MSRKRKILGNCYICGIYGSLSFEHVPPEKAFNRSPAVRAKMEEWFTKGKWTGKGKKDQRGAGEYTLCESCNSNTGSWYGAEYVEWAKRAFQMLGRIPGGKLTEAGLVPTTFTNARPLRFIKQAITMIFSANSPEFAAKNPELVKFVLNREARGLPPKYDVFMSLLRGTHSRMSGVSGELRLDRGDHVILSEVAHPPFGIVMTFDSKLEDDFGRISYFANFGLDERRDVNVLMHTGEIFSMYPNDHRAEAVFRQ